MSTVTKSPRKVAAVALEVGERTLPTFSCAKSRQTFTLPQLFACLVLRQFWKADYRKTTAFLTDMPRLREDLGLRKVPHYTTLQKAEARLLTDDRIRDMLEVQIAMFFKHPGKQSKAKTAEVIRQAAADSTGISIDQASRYFVKRQKNEIRKAHEKKGKPRTNRRYAKLGLLVCCGTHFILSALPGMGPKPDVNELRPMVEKMPGNVLLEQMLLDAGYDSEPNHELVREELDAESVIPPLAGRPSENLPTGKYRWLMATDFNDDDYGQRSQVEAVNFMLKQHLGSVIASRKEDSRMRELSLRSLAFNCLRIAAEG